MQRILENVGNARREIHFDEEHHTAYAATRSLTRTVPNGYLRSSSTNRQVDRYLGTVPWSRGTIHNAWRDYNNNAWTFVLQVSSELKARCLDWVVTILQDYNRHAAWKLKIPITAIRMYKPLRCQMTETGRHMFSVSQRLMLFHDNVTRLRDATLLFTQAPPGLKKISAANLIKAAWAIRHTGARPCVGCKRATSMWQLYWKITLSAVYTAIADSVVPANRHATGW